MSVARAQPGPDGPRAAEKITLERTDEVWNQLSDDWVNRSPRHAQFRAKALAMAVLRFVAGWPLERIGLAFGQHRGRVMRSIARCGHLIREECELRPVAEAAEPGPLDPVAGDE